MFQGGSGFYEQNKPAPVQYQAPNVYDYIGYGNPGEANAFLQSKGYPASRNPKEIGARLAHYLMKAGDSGLPEIMALHPDKEQIMDLVPKTSGFAGPANGHHNASGGCGCNSHNNFLNCSGCGGTCGGGGHNNFTGNMAANFGMQEKTFNVLAVLAIVGIFAMVIQPRSRA